MRGIRSEIRTGIATSAALLFCLVLAGTLRSQEQAPAAAATPAPARPQTPAATTVAAPPASPQARPATPASPQRALVDQYCIGCHSDRVKSGGLALSTLNLDDVHQNAEVAEKVIRKLRGGLMPPAGAKRPDKEASAAFVTWLENELDKGKLAAAPGRVPLRRLNRREYANAIRDLLGYNVDAKALLPDDNRKGHYDNNASALQVSPNFVDQYIYAARAVALDAVGNRKAPPVTTTYGEVANMVISLPPSVAPGTGRQQHRLEGLPFGTRGGMVVEHNFPADGEYELTIGDMALAREVPRMEFENTVIALLDGKEFYRTTVGGDADHKAIDQRLDPAVEEINGRLRKIRFTAAAGQHKLAVTFVHRTFAESDERTRTAALEGGQERIQAVHALQIRGPLKVTGMTVTSGSRAKIFICHPGSTQTAGASTAQETACAQRIVSNLARRAFRRPVTDAEIDAADGLLQVGLRAGRLRYRRARCGQRHPREPALPVSRRSWRRAPRRPHAQRSRAGLAFLLLHLEQHSGR